MLLVIERSCVLVFVCRLKSRRSLYGKLKRRSSVMLRERKCLVGRARRGFVSATSSIQRSMCLARLRVYTRTEVDVWLLHVEAVRKEKKYRRRVRRLEVCFWDLLEFVHFMLFVLDFFQVSFFFFIYLFFIFLEVGDVL